MNKLILLILSSTLFFFSNSAVAYDRGESAYGCFKNSSAKKFLWFFGKEWEACTVRILEKAGPGSYKVEMTDYCSASSNKEHGEVFWYSGSLHSSKESCEG